jgi:hypothetical protein
MACRCYSLRGGLVALLGMFSLRVDDTCGVVMQTSAVCYTVRSVLLQTRHCYCGHCSQPLNAISRVPMDAYYYGMLTVLLYRYSTHATYRRPPQKALYSPYLNPRLCRNVYPQLSRHRNPWDCHPIHPQRCCNHHRHRSHRAHWFRPLRSRRATSCKVLGYEYDVC